MFGIDVVLSCVVEQMLFLVLLKVTFFILGLTKAPFGIFSFLFSLGFLSKS